MLLQIILALVALVALYLAMCQDVGRSIKTQEITHIIFLGIYAITTIILFADLIIRWDPYSISKMLCFALFSYILLNNNSDEVIGLVCISFIILFIAALLTGQYYYNKNIVKLEECTTEKYRIEISNLNEKTYAVQIDGKINYKQLLEYGGDEIKVIPADNTNVIFVDEGYYLLKIVETYNIINNNVNPAEPYGTEVVEKYELYIPQNSIIII
jgi:hypothetical protein